MKKRKRERLEMATSNKEEKPICTICKGHFPFASESAYGIKPDRKSNPDLFICWECVHWLQKVFNDHINNFSYSLLFTDKEIQVGRYSSRVIRDEKVLPVPRFVSSENKTGGS